jgi:hypothetical protein
MNKLEKLAIRHAEIAAEIKTNKDQVALEISYCTGGEYDNPDSCDDFSYLERLANQFDTCLNHSYHAFADMNANNDDHYSYDEILSNYGCRHCNSARNLKKHIGKLKQEKGRIHSAMTNIGKSLMHFEAK